jgi:hypothetical protein
MNKASEYRQQAEELRRAAMATRDRITRKTLLKLAEEFDRMAAHPVQNHPKQMPRITDA